MMGGISHGLYDSVVGGAWAAVLLAPPVVVLPLAAAPGTAFTLPGPPLAAFVFVLLFEVANMGLLWRMFLALAPPSAAGFIGFCPGRGEGYDSKVDEIENERGRVRKHKRECN